MSNRTCTVHSNLIPTCTGWLLRVLVCTSIVCIAKPAAGQYFLITNTQPFPRLNEVIVFNRSLFKNTADGFFAMVLQRNQVLISQLIDEDNSGHWNQLLVQVSLAPNETDTIQIKWVKRIQQQSFAKRANVQLSLRSATNMPSPEMNSALRHRGFIQNIAKPFYQLEGPGIENDKVAFRAFFDYRNSKDIFGKIVDTPVLETVGVGASWHELQPWGMDIFHTANSLGAGGLAVEEDKSIFRLGDADTSSFKTLYEGALSAAFMLEFKNWDVGTGKKNGSEQISMTTGTFYYKDVINLSLKQQQNLIAGIANFGLDSAVQYKKHNADFSSVATYGNQAEGTNSRLGVAIMFASGDYIYHRTTDTASVIPNTTYIALKPSANNKKTIYFFACWEKTDKRFSEQKGFEDYLQQTAESLAHPVQVKIYHQKKS